MKALPLLAWLLVCAYSFAEELPSDAVRLKESYLEARKRVLEPVDQRYLDELQKLVRIYTRDGQLDIALAIRREIEQVEAMRGGEDLPIAGPWEWTRDQYMVFSPNRTAILLGYPKGHLRYTWEPAAGRSINLVCISPQAEGKRLTVKFAANFTTAEATDGQWTASIKRP